MTGGTSLRDASAIAEDAFVRAYPLVVTGRAVKEAPLNVLLHARDTPDTLRLSAWIDLAAEPVVLIVPPTHGHYYVLWLRDAWNRQFASVGARTTGAVPQALVLLGPGSHNAPLPPGLTPVKAPTRFARVTGCLEAVGEPDDEARRGFALLPLSRWLSARAPVIPLPAASKPAERMDARAFFAAASRLVEDNPADAEVRAALARLQALGPWSSLAPDQRASLERGVQRGLEAIRTEAALPPGELVGRWRVGYDRPSDRMGLAADVLWATLDSDADGRPLTGSGRYRLRFAPDAPPPVHGFWSLTAGDGQALGDRRGLELDCDGSLPIHIQREPPPRKRRSNWLPTPPRAFSIALHLYWPGDEALQRRWLPPPLERVE
jgi:hypothetical protein